MLIRSLLWRIFKLQKGKYREKDTSLTNLSNPHLIRLWE